MGVEGVNHVLRIFIPRRGKCWLNQKPIISLRETLSNLRVSAAPSSVESVKIRGFRVTIPPFMLHGAIGTITSPHSCDIKSLKYSSTQVLKF